MIVSDSPEIQATSSQSTPMLSRRAFIGAMLAAPFALGAAMSVPEPALAISKPRAPRITAWSPKVKAVALRWTKVSGAKGYQVRLYSSATLKKVVKTKLSTRTTCTVSGLKTGSFYYARVRAYKVKNGKRIYGAWSPKVLVRTKVAKSLFGSGSSITKATRTYLARYLRARNLSTVHGHEGSVTKGGLACVSCVDQRMLEGYSSYTKPFGLIIERDGSIYKDAGYSNGALPRKGKLLIK